MKLYPVALHVLTNEAVRVAAEDVHMTPTARDAAVAHDNGDLVQRFGQAGPEVPVVLGASQAGTRVALHGVVQIGELERIAEEEHWRVVAHQVPVAFFRVELDRKAADVPLGIGRTTLAGH
ncbi:hypothetical protein D9M72_104360 [compost metagenome]